MKKKEGVETNMNAILENLPPQLGPSIIKYIKRQNKRDEEIEERKSEERTRCPPR